MAQECRGLLLLVIRDQRITHRLFGACYANGKGYMHIT